LLFACQSGTTKKKEETKMSSNSKAASVPQISQFSEDKHVSEETRFAQYTLLDELPGLIFGLMTLAYIVSSLWSLA